MLKYLFILLADCPRPSLACASRKVIIGAAMRLSPGRRQAGAGLLPGAGVDTLAAIP
jgi:hypothetical protein